VRTSPERLLLSGLHKPFAHAPLVLAHEHPTELRESIGAVLERAEDLLALLDRQRESRPPASTPSR
jgi:hypothetical protein